MTARKKVPTDDPNQQGLDQSIADPYYNDAALREAISRITAEVPDGEPLNDADRQARIDALREEIANGSYLADERIGDIVDRLLKKWKL